MPNLEILAQHNRERLAKAKEIADIAVVMEKALRSY